ncbi:hypothetical protein BFW01_g943 [Lasiodiplodia theobromae]|uniref:Nucleoside phosphorylase domain-containing protein n=1 Tax=Lasiodiplodia theobromae TaxID=45133 RepID=A0A8H7MCH3_9PEZI|nr:hypothetical protein BFW01_g943 [Lasiodiplodia theobromae]
MAEPELSHDDYTVAWICPIEVEQIPAILMLDTEHHRLPQSPNDHNVYTLGSINGHNIVVASLPTAGNCPAATVITQMRNTFRNLRFCLLVGIGGGVPTTTDQGPLRLGHVVVSKPSGTQSGVIQCDHGKVEADGKLYRTGVLALPPSVLLNSAQQMSVKRRIARQDPLIKHLQRVDTSPEMMPEYKYPGREKDPLFDREVQSFRNLRSEAMDDDGCPRWIVVHRGTIATGEKVVKNAEWRDRLHEAFGAICFEMEAAGVLADFPCLVIRGVSDYADQSKNDDWQPYAAASAAAYARELFFHMPVDQVKQCSIPEKGWHIF